MQITERTEDNIPIVSIDGDIDLDHCAGKLTTGKQVAAVRRIIQMVDSPTRHRQRVLEAHGLRVPEIQAAQPLRYDTPYRSE